MNHLSNVRQIDNNNNNNKRTASEGNIQRISLSYCRNKFALVYWGKTYI